MTGSLSRLTAIALACCAVACGDSRQAPVDAAPADASAPADAGALDAPPAVDDDHDGFPAARDCDDHDPLVWQRLAYGFVDGDGDGHTVARAGTICTGATLPRGYSTTPGAPDCDDGDPRTFAAMAGFLDTDGDGFGSGVAVTLCTSGTLPVGFAANGGDCAAMDAARWVERAYLFRDGDGDGAAIAEAGLVCSGAALPSGYLDAAPVGRPLDCDDANPAVSTALTVFADADADGVGAGPSQLACTAGSPPAGFATLGTDCDDGNAAVWTSLLYTAVDFDGDGVTVPSLGMRCTAGALAPPYYATSRGNDCDDADARVSVALTVFADVDRDGFGAGPAQLACTSGAPPVGFAATGTDCDDGDATRWALLPYVAIDADDDGVTVAATGQRCTDGVLPPPFRAAATGNDCDDHDPALTQFAVLYPDRDGDGVGAPPRQVVCIGAAPPAGLSRGGYDDDDGDPQVIEDEDSDDVIDLLLLDG